MFNLSVDIVFYCCAEAITPPRAFAYLLRVASRAVQVRLFAFGTAAPAFSRCVARVLHPKGFYALCRARHGVRVPPLRSGAPCLHCRRDAVDPQSLSLADVLARPFQQRFTVLIELDDARQVARYELIRATACLKPGCCTTAAFLKHRIHAALQHCRRDQGRLMRVSRREHEKGIHCCWRNSPAVLA